jgi:histone H3/H4
MARTKISPKASVERIHLASDVNLGCTMAARRSAPGVGGFKRKRRAKPGVKAAREVTKMMRTTDLQIPRDAFHRLVRELGWDYKTDLRWGKTAVDALHEATEDFITHLFEESLRAMVHAKRDTVSLEDVKFARDTLMRCTRFGTE